MGKDCADGAVRAAVADGPPSLTLNLGSGDLHADDQDNQGDSD